MDSNRIKTIEDKSVNWKLMDVAYSKDYYVMEQANAENKFNGNIKIVSVHEAVYQKRIFHSDKLDASQEDFVYYERIKKGARNEI